MSIFTVNKLKQGLTHRSATLLLRVPLVFPPFGWKKLKAKSRHCIDIIHIYHINKLSIRNMLLFNYMKRSSYGRK